MSVKIYHNPRCSKSRETLALLEEKGTPTEVIEYLKTPPDETTLKTIIESLGIKAMQLVRSHEDEFKQAGLDNEGVTEDEIIKAMVKYPKLIERPIVVNGNKVVIGRPPKNILTIID
ncbi:Uncharacterized protein YfgD, not an arsenate reductase [hydrothermal vent metagenome]|uniref:Uncharacterized protein YfgD, not an arsenate reductase n=1 Tax=hydrothermal vent metagenome TaxID=652676 RepID=A0A3B0ZD61_9ZZZZ